MIKLLEEKFSKFEKKINKLETISIKNTSNLNIISKTYQHLEISFQNIENNNISNYSLEKLFNQGEQTPNTLETMGTPEQQKSCYVQQLWQNNNKIRNKILSYLDTPDIIKLILINRHWRQQIVPSYFQHVKDRNNRTIEIIFQQLSQNQKNLEEIQNLQLCIKDLQYQLKFNFDKNKILALFNSTSPVSGELSTLKALYIFLSNSPNESFQDWYQYREIILKKKDDIINGMKKFKIKKISIKSCQKIQELFRAQHQKIFLGLFNNSSQQQSKTNIKTIQKHCEPIFQWLELNRLINESQTLDSSDIQCCKKVQKLEHENNKIEKYIQKFSKTIHFLPEKSSKIQFSIKSNQLYSIFQFLNMKDLIYCRSVNKLWNRSVKNLLIYNVNHLERQISQTQIILDNLDVKKSHQKSLSLIKRILNPVAKIEFLDLKYLDTPPKEILALIQAHFLLNPANYQITNQNITNNVVNQQNNNNKWLPEWNFLRNNYLQNSQDFFYFVDQAKNFGIFYDFDDKIWKKVREIVFLKYTNQQIERFGKVAITIFSWLQLVDGLIRNDFTLSGLKNYQEEQTKINHYKKQLELPQRLNSIIQY